MALTDEQTGIQKQRLKARFHALRMEISEELRESDDTPYIELAGQIHDAAEASVADLLKDLKLASVDRHIQEVQATERALLRLAKGTYGVCVDCRGPIPFERLEVQPTASRCQACRARFEKTVSASLGKGPSL